MNLCPTLLIQAAPEGDSFNLSGDEIKSEILTDMKAFDYEPTDQAQTQESIPLLTHLGEDQPLMICDSIRIITSPDAFIAENDQGKPYFDNLWPPSVKKT